MRGLDARSPAYGSLTEGSRDAGAEAGENPFRCPARTSPSDTPPPRLAPPTPAISLPPCGEAPLQTLSSPDSETSASSHGIRSSSFRRRTISRTQYSLSVSRDCASPPRLASGNLPANSPFLTGPSCRPALIPLGSVLSLRLYYSTEPSIWADLDLPAGASTRRGEPQGQSARRSHASPAEMGGVCK